MEDLCSACLCRGRKLFTLEPIGLCELYSQLLIDIPWTIEKKECWQICWECYAKLKNWQKFRNQAQSSYKLLLEHAQKTSVTLQPYSTLSVDRITNTSYPEYIIKTESTQDEVKSETEEHREPETFVIELTVERSRKKKDKEKTPKKHRNRLKSDNCNPLSIDDEDSDLKLDDDDDDDKAVDAVDDHDAKAVDDEQNGHQESEDSDKKKSDEMKLLSQMPYSNISLQNLSDLVIDQIMETNNCKKETVDDNFTVHQPKKKTEKRNLLKPRKMRRTKITRKKKLKEDASDDISSPVDDVVCDDDEVLDDTNVNHDMENQKGCIDNNIDPSNKIPLKLRKKRKLRKSKSIIKKSIDEHSDNVSSPIDDDVMCEDDVLDDTDVENHREEFVGDKKNIKMETGKLVFPNKKMIGEKPQCLECGKVFSSKKTFRYHWNVLHKGQNRYPCPTCGKVYQWKSNLGRHLRSHKARDSGELYCELCDKRFASVATYRQHLKVSRRHVTENEFSFICNECGKKFVSKTRLRDHIDWEHLKKIKFRCELCHKPFKCYTSLYVHMQNVHANKEKDLCHVCGKAYQNAAKLKYHIVAMHTDETPYECVHCRVSFGWYSSLYRHVKEVHHKIKLQPKKSSKKSKKLDLLPSLLNHHPPLHTPVPT